MNKKKVVVVIGVGQGIGRAITYKFAKNGEIVYFTSRKKELGQKLQDELKKINCNIHYICADCSKEKEVMRLRDKILRREKIIDILIINTGKWINKTLVEHTEEDYNELINSNFKVHFLVYKNIGEYFKKQKRGIIFSVVGVYGTRFLPVKQSVYNATKAACMALSKSYAQELAPYGVRLFIISPGVTSHSLFSKEPLKKIETDINLNRSGLPEDIALFIEKIASFPSIFATGTAFEIAGALSSTIY